MKRTIAAAIIVSLSTCALAADKIDIRPVWKPGQYVQTISVEMDQSTQVGQDKTQQHIEMLMAAQLDVQTPAQGAGSEVTMTIKRVQQSVTGGPVNIVYDSAAPAGESDAAFAPLAAMIDMPLVMTLDEKGELVRVTGMDAIWDKMSQSNPELAAQMAPMKELFGKQMFEQLQMAKTMPQQPLGKGESWQGESEMALPFVGNVQLQQKYTVQEIRQTPAGQAALVQYVGTFERSEQAQTQPGTMPGGLSIDSVRVEQEGQMTYDESIGTFVDGTINQNGTVKASVPGPENQPMQLEMEQRGVVKTKLEKGAYKAPTTLPATATRPATRPATAPQR